MLKLLISCFFCLIATVAAANEVLDIRSCNTSIRGNIISLKYDANSHWSGPNPWLAENFTLREKAAILSKKLPWRKEQNLNCPSAITMAEIAPDFEPLARGKFCLYWDKTQETYLGFDEGPGNAYGVCENAKTVCEHVGGTKGIATGLIDRFTGMARGLIDRYAGIASGLVLGAAGVVVGGEAVASATGVTAVLHSSGAVILTGPSGYVAGSISTFGATVLAASSSTATVVTAATASVVTAPITLAAVGFVAASVGVTVYLCRDNL